MSYKDDILRPFRESGEWDRLPSHRRKVIEQLLEDPAVAASIASLMDSEEADATWRRLTLSQPDSPEADRLAREEARRAAEEMQFAFRGGLVRRGLNGIELTELGRALATFLRAAKEEGFDFPQTAESLAVLSPITLLSLSQLESQ
jgi:hypothetical protein